MSSPITLSEHAEYIREHAEFTESATLKHYEKVSDSFIQSIFVPMMDQVRQIIYLNPCPESILCCPKRNRQFNPLNHRSYTIRIKMKRSAPIYRNVQEEYSHSTFRTWDRPFLRMIYDDDVDPYSPTESLEMNLMRYIASHDRPPTGTLWIEQWAEEPSIVRSLRNSKSMMWYSLPRMLMFVQDNEQYASFERKLSKATRLLSNKTSSEQYETLKEFTKLRTFLEAVKTRSHLPTAYGIYCMNAMNACKYSKSKIAEYIMSPQSAPTPLKNMLAYYWFQMLMPYDRDAMNSIPPC
jgi:hypothetical protein